LRTVGIDLAAEPKGTAVTVIEWSGVGAKVVLVDIGATDLRIVELAVGAQKLGIDCALGWPTEFVAFLQNQTATGTVSAVDGGLDWRRRLAYRETDRYVRSITGRWPLSVATDRLGMTALRCSGLLARLQESGVEIDRSGEGLIVEVYPGATLRIWGLALEGYRTSSELRNACLDDLKVKAPWLDFDEFRHLLVESCDAFDSLIAALATRAAALGQYEKPSEDLRKLAQTEGWIALPNQGLDQLLSQ
jgi:predicted nuclease with RNAse H fold